jgi:competence protein ComEC
VVAAGIGWAGQWLMLQASWWAIVFMPALLALALTRKPRLVLIAMLFAAAVASSLIQSHHQQYRDDTVRVSEFRVISEPQRWGNAQRQWLELPDGRRGHFEPLEPMANGASYQAAMRFKPLPRAERGAFAASLLTEPELIRPPPSQTAFITRLRAEFIGHLRGVSPDAAGLVAGLAIGERNLLSSETEDNMKALSLTHLVAVSGANLAIVIGAVYLLARGLAAPRGLRFALAALATAGYVSIVGPEPSVLRAAAMAYAVLVAAWLGRATQAAQALSWAVLVLVIADPWLAADFAFALSVLATAGLIILGPALFELLRARLPDWLALGISVTFAAQLYTLPVLLMLQSGLPTYSVLANILAEPVVAPVTILGITAAVFSVQLPWLTEWLSWLASLGTVWIEFIATTLSQLPNVRASWPSGPVGIMLTVALALALSVAILRRSRRALAAGLAALLTGFGIMVPAQLQAASWPPADWVIASCDVGQGDAYVVRSAGAVAVIDVGPDENKLRGCFRQLRLERIDLLVLTHFDFDHVGAIAAVDVPVTSAVISGYPDDRRAVASVRERLSELGADVLIARPGLGGQLGELNWLVLAPTKTASEANDSNDASVVVQFWSEQLSLLTLGDLSAAGQRRLLRAQSSNLATLGQAPLVLKVSHHGSADQDPELHQWLRPTIALISVGKNRYRHPTPELVEMLDSLGALVLRTDKLGHISLSLRGQLLEAQFAGRVVK